MPNKLAPSKMRLTLSKEATALFPKIITCKYHGWLCVPRSDGKYDIPISPALYDQLQTAALPRENFSDTVIRLAAAKA